MTVASQTGDKQQGTRNKQLPDQSSGLRSELLIALAGHDANRDRKVAQRTRRVVISSRGVMQEQKQNRSRVRGVALAVTFIVLLLIAPLLWEATDSLIAGEHFGDLGNQLSLWACIVCPTLLGAALVAGWWKHRS